MSIYNIGTCDYCGEENKITRGTPFMADVPASMCEYCWTETKIEYANSNGEYIDSFDSLKEQYEEVKKSIENGVKVYQIFLDRTPGWIADSMDGFKEELESINCERMGSEKVNVDFAMKCLELMIPGDEFSCKGVKFKCFKMSKEKLGNLPEFAGW